jgi:hypothetical protein
MMVRGANLGELHEASFASGDCTFSLLLDEEMFEADSGGLTVLELTFRPRPKELAAVRGEGEPSAATSVVVVLDASGQVLAAGTAADLEHGSMAACTASEPDRPGLI